MQTVHNAHSMIKRMIDKEHNLSEERVRTMLTASIMRYLKGRTSLSFVTELAAEISEGHDALLKGDLLEVVSFLNLLDHQRRFTNISQKAVDERLHQALDKLATMESLHIN